MIFNREDYDNHSRIHDDVNSRKDKSTIKCYSCENYRYYVAECHNKKRDEEANLTFMHDEEPILMSAEKMSNLLILNEEKIMTNFRNDRIETNRANNR